MVEKNVGGHDRVLSKQLGIALMLTGLATPLFDFFVVQLLGLVAIGTGIALYLRARSQKCPVNHALGTDTTGDDENLFGLF